MAKHVAVLRGSATAGAGRPHASGTVCADALEQAGYRVSQLGWGEGVAAALAAMRPDAVFLADDLAELRNGTIQGLLEGLQIPYTHSGVLASALSADRQRAKIVAKSAGIPLVPSLVIRREEAAARHAMTPPYVVKQAMRGPSYGVMNVGEGASVPPPELDARDWPFDARIMIERHVGGRDLRCLVMGDVALGVAENAAKTGVAGSRRPAGRESLSKYEDGAKIKRNIYQRIQTLALTAHQAIGCRGVSLSGFRYDDGPLGNGELVWLGIETHPDLSPGSLAAGIAAQAGHEFETLLTWMVEDASCNR